LKPIAKENKLGRGKVLQKSVTLNVQREVAKIAKVSHDTVSKVKYIEKKGKFCLSIMKEDKMKRSILTNPKDEKVSL